MPDVLYDGPTEQIDVFTVSEVSSYIEEIFRVDPLLTNVWVTGEVSNFVRASSGHLYFSLKDPDAALKCVMWRSNSVLLERMPRDGEHVLAHGYVGLYKPRGEYQLYVDVLQPAGVGVLYQEFLRIKAKLEAEGLFDESRKRPIPRFPRRLGIVTSPTGAALRDILRILRERYPVVEVVLAHAVVQGDDAPVSIVRALRSLNQCCDLDAIIVARGGGSIEDLWAFNDESVARAIAGSRVPVISGVGHETDFTIADFVADLRAPTPTGAAMAAVPDRAQLKVLVEGYRKEIETAVSRSLNGKRLELRRLRAALSMRSPVRWLGYQRQAVDDMNRRLILAMNRGMERRRHLIGSEVARLEALDPKAVLQRGYAVVRDLASGSVVSSVNEVEDGQWLSISVSDGDFSAEVGIPEK